ncbi:Protein kinase-like domain containing protein, partial [Elaphomyces granulatus]
TKPITPRGLRAPELILSDTVDPTIDIWSFGCLIFELITGQPLFCVPGYETREDEDDVHLLHLSNILGPLPEPLYNLWARSRNYFNVDRELIKTFLDEVPEGKFFDEEKPDDIPQNEAKAITDLMRWILQYDPAKRPTPSEILRHSWFVDEVKADRGILYIGSLF